MSETTGEEDMGMAPEDLGAMMEQRYREMRQRIAERQRQVQERWGSYFKILDELTPEQKEAVQAVYGAALSRSFQPHRCPRPSGMPMHPPGGRSGFGNPWGMPFPGPGYGSQAPDGPYFGWGEANPWFGQGPAGPGMQRP